MTEPIKQFLFTELADDALTDGRAFDGVAFGTFSDMYGREITLEADDAAAFVANTQAAIAATTTESGELVGLPIDAEGHDKGDGAGWIVGVELVEGVIRLVPKWTEIGRELISKGIRRFFSATIDTSNKVVLGGTLTNWPATRDENNRLMLRPIELQDGFFTVAESEREPVDAAPLDISGDDDMAKETVEQEQEEVVAAEPAELATPPPESGQEAAPAAEVDPQVTAELMRKFQEAGDQDMVKVVESVQRQAAELARLEVEELHAKRQREWEVTNLAAQYIGGGKYGLPVKTDELSRFLDSLNTQQFEMATALFDRITKGGLIEFQERGHARKLRQKQLPEVYHGPLKATLEAGNSIAAFFEVQDLGEPSDYDLSMFKEEK
jgi:hypothetical protein